MGGADRAHRGASRADRPRGDGTWEGHRAGRPEWPGGSTLPAAATAGACAGGAIGRSHWGDVKCDVCRGAGFAAGHGRPGLQAIGAGRQHSASDAGGQTEAGGAGAVAMGEAAEPQEPRAESGVASEPAGGRHAAPGPRPGPGRRRRWVRAGRPWGKLPSLKSRVQSLVLRPSLLVGATQRPALRVPRRARWTTKAAVAAWESV